MFHRRYLWDNRDSFSVSVPESAVTRYPTGYDDIALIKLPIYLVFTDEIKPIKLGGKPFNDLVVMAGFNDYSSKDLTYGMFALASKNVCKRDYGSEFDEYLQLCTLGWRNNNQAPCTHDEGGGLVTGWPTQPRLIGVLSRSTSCKEAAPAVFTDVNKYLDWMISVTGNDLLIEWDN
ncbi:unnamed protein product [Hermetia illucens]|uniref:Peptidase S1 domain-containing protein n=2 Tax=Hermetia illucens TaxID=343691 RepID=A0A7R8YPQ9_HERIL|nr:unnamed protein product [Hermetia illucens]